MRKVRVYFETYGCSHNKADTKIMEEAVSRRFEITGNVETAEVIVLNTCYVKTSTEHRIINRIKSLVQRFPQKKMIIAGCMPMVDKERALESNPAASLVGTQNVDMIAEAIEEALNGRQSSYLEYRKLDKSKIPKLWKQSNIIRIIQICEGCTDACRYCCTRIARGHIFSYDIDNITEEIKANVLDGAREFWLTAQDTCAYGIDNNKQNLTELIKRVVEIPGEFFVRIGMMNPNHALNTIDELTEIFREPKVFKFLHLPVQSGSNKILRVMGRKYTVEEAEKVIKLFRQKIPRITLATDIIVGYPGEDDKDFEKTMGFLHRIRPDITNLSKFGKRPRTPVEIGEKYDITIVKKRTRLVHETISRLQLEGYQKWIGWKGKLLVDELIRGDSVGRNEYYRNIVLKENVLLGSIIHVEVVKASKHFLLGRIL